MKRANKERKFEMDKKNQILSEYISQQAEEIDEMKNELNDCRRRIEDHEKYSEILKQLYENEWYIDLNSNPVDRYK